MTNEIGTMKLALASATQTSLTAPTGRSQMDVQEKAQAPLANPVEATEKSEEDAEPLKEVMSHLKELVRELHRELEFSVDQESGDTVIRVIDRETDEVVRQIPSEELMHLRRRLEEAAGVIFQDSA